MDGKTIYRNATNHEIQVCCYLKQLEKKIPEIHLFQASFEDYIIVYVEGCPKIVKRANLFLLMSRMLRFFKGNKYTYIAIDIEKIYSAILDSYQVKKEEHLNPELRKFCYYFDINLYFDSNLTSQNFQKLALEKERSKLCRMLSNLEKFDEGTTEYITLSKEIQSIFKISQDQVECFESIYCSIKQYRKKPKIKILVPILQSFEKQFNLVYVSDFST